MKALLIDPFCMEDLGGILAVNPADAVREIEIEGGLASIYQALSHELHPVDCIDAVYLNEASDCVYVDDNGLFANAGRFFLWKGYPQPLAGRGLIVGTDDEGNTVAPRMTLDEARAHILLGYSNAELDAATGYVRALPQHFARHHMEGFRA